MPNLPISQLVSATNTTQPDFYPLVQGGVNKKVTFGILQNSLGISTLQTTYIGSTSGNAVWSMPFQSTNYKKFTINLQALTDLGTTITFPTPFTTVPHIYGDTGALAISSTNLTTFTLLASSGITGNVFVEGY